MGNSNQSNPYVGLRPFDVDESLLFFGRDDQTLELLQRLHKRKVVLIARWAYTSIERRFSCK